jgi:hypothetical protein
MLSLRACIKINTSTALVTVLVLAEFLSYIVTVQLWVTLGGHPLFSSSKH